MDYLLAGLAAGVAEEQHGVLGVYAVERTLVPLDVAETEVRHLAAEGVGAALARLEAVCVAHVVGSAGAFGRRFDERQVKVFVAHGRVGIVEILGDQLGHTEISPGRRVGQLLCLQLGEEVPDALLRRLQGGEIVGGGVLLDFGQQGDIVGKCLLNLFVEHSEHCFGRGGAVAVQESVPVMLHGIFRRRGRIVAIDARHLDRGEMAGGGGHGRRRASHQGRHRILPGAGVGTGTAPLSVVARPEACHCKGERQSYEQYFLHPVQIYKFSL